MIKGTVEFLKNNGKKSEIVELSRSIIDQRFFSAILVDKKPWELLRVLFAEIITEIDFNAFIGEFFHQSQQGFWLVAALLCSQ